jgi:hypothetical protein
MHRQGLNYSEKSLPQESMRRQDLFLKKQMSIPELSVSLACEIG